MSVLFYLETLPASSKLFELLRRDLERVELAKDLLPEMFLQALPSVTMVANLKLKQNRILPGVAPVRVSLSSRSTGAGAHADCPGFAYYRDEVFRICVTGGCVFCRGRIYFCFFSHGPQQTKEKKITNCPLKFHIKTSNEQIRMLPPLYLPRVAPASERTTPNNIKPGNPLTSLM